MFMLNKQEELKYLAIKKLEEKTLTRKEVSFELGISLRQVDRLRKVYREEGEQGFVHKNHGKVSHTKKDAIIIEELESLYLTKYFDFNFEHFYEKIKDEYDISYSSMYMAFLNDDIISPLAHKETMKLYNEKMNSAMQNGENVEIEILEKQQELFQSRKIAYEKAHPRKPSNMFGFGQEVQMDASQNFWFGEISTYLHLAVDKGTKKVLAGWFEYEELTRGYFVLLYNLIVNYGIPAKIKTDNRNSFSNNKNKVDTTQFGIICETLRIELETTSIPTKKSNVERENRTFKDRLIAELRFENIKTIDEANEYLNNVFIPHMNKNFSYEINEATSKMRPNNYTEEELNLIISEKYTRIVDNASSVKYSSKYYIPINPNTGETIHFLKKTECQFIITYNGEFWCKIEDNYYQLVEIESRDTTMKKEKDNNKPTEKKKYIPPKNHPWRKNMMLK